MRDFPLRAWLYTGALVGVAIFAVAMGSPSSGLQWSEATKFGILVVLCGLAPITFPNASYSVSFVVVMAAVISLGPAGAGFAAAFEAIDPSVRGRPDWLGRSIFNAAQLCLSTTMAGCAYDLSGGPVGSLAAADFPEIFLALAVAALVHFLVNTSAVACMVTIVRRVPWRQVWSANFLSVVAGSLGFALLGVMLAALYLQMGLSTLIFLLVPLLVARHAVQAAAAMDVIYEDTVRALAGAIEAKDSYTRGHAERVARVSEMIATELGMPALRVRALKIAALMHDVGKLVVETQILTKPGKLTEEEYEHMKLHPVAGTSIVTEIDFLRDGDAVDAVRHHHERMDGRGYPDGLMADEVPLVARIVMCADAFDSMTSTRSYRFAKPVDDALRELRRCSAKQFDPLVLGALTRAVTRHGWEPSPETFQGERTDRPLGELHEIHEAHHGHGRHGGHGGHHAPVLPHAPSAQQSPGAHVAHG